MGRYFYTSRYSTDDESSGGAFYRFRSGRSRRRSRSSYSVSSKYESPNPRTRLLLEDAPQPKDRHGEKKTRSKRKRLQASTSPRADTTLPGPIYDMGTGWAIAQELTQPFAREWTHAECDLGNGTTTKLIIARSAEHQVLKSGEEQLRLSCFRNLPQLADMKPENLVWLHVQHRAMHTYTSRQCVREFENYIMNCPYIPLSTRAGTLDNLRDISDKIMEKGQHVSVRVVDRVPGNFQSICLYRSFFPILSLVSSPSLDVSNTADLYTATRTLLSNKLGYYEGLDRESYQVLARTGLCSDPTALRLSSLYTLGLLESNVLITMCPFPAADICSNLVDFEFLSPIQSYMAEVRLIDVSKRVWKLVINPDCSYVVSNLFLNPRHHLSTPTNVNPWFYANNVNDLWAFLQQAVTSVSASYNIGTSLDNEIVYTTSTKVGNATPSPHELSILTPAAWLELLASKLIQDYIFFLQPESHIPPLSRSRRPYQYRPKDNEPTSPEAPRVSLQARTANHMRLLEGAPPHPPNGQEAFDPEPPVQYVDQQGASEMVFLEDDNPLLSTDTDSSDNDAMQPNESVNRRSIATSASIGSGQGGTQAVESHLVLMTLPKGRFDPLPISAGVTKTPFFSWRVGIGQVEGSLPVASDTVKRAVSILSRINCTLRSNNAGIGALHDKTFQCSLDDLLARHLDDTIHPPVRESSKEQQRATATGPHGTRIEAASGPVSAGLQTAASMTQDGRKLGIKEDLHFKHTNQLSEYEASVQRLIDISRQVIWSYIPRNGDAPSHLVVRRFWGSVDGIIRQLKWATEWGSPETKVWRIHRLDVRDGVGLGNIKTRRSEAGCEVCSSSAPTTYPSALAAIEHLHAFHCECALMEKPGMSQKRTRQFPYDDPCYGLVSAGRVKPGIPPRVATLTEEFIETLSEIPGKLNELHWLVARGASTDDRRPQHDTLPPQLPSSLVYAFEAMVEYYLVFAKQVSLENRRGNPELPPHVTVDISNRCKRMADYSLRSYNEIQQHLQQAKKDIILWKGHGISDLVDSTLGTPNIDCEFIVAAIFHTLLARTLARPPVLKEFNNDMDDVFGTRGQDILTIYTDYSLRLRAASVRKPHRRLILDIRSLLEECSALHALVSETMSSLDCESGILRKNLMFLSEVASSENRGRVLRAAQKDFLSRHGGKLKKLQGQLREIRSSMIEAEAKGIDQIAIINDNHGKAIRMFTIVTVFFLPLSFVTSFFGMNTNDIRDINADQALYWAIAVPVTVIVLAIAFLYGYKGDEIKDWIRGDRYPYFKANSSTPLLHRWTRPKRSIAFPPNPEQDGGLASRSPTDLTTRSTRPPKDQRHRLHTRGDGRGITRKLRFHLPFEHHENGDLNDTNTNKSANEKEPGDVYTSGGISNARRVSSYSNMV